jgi:POT family proton-dependent oligopeptide transporter
LPVYAFTFIGGIFADKVLGLKSPFLLRHDSGNLIIAFSPLHFFLFGNYTTIIGTGFFKPNIFNGWEFYGQS